MWFTTIILVQTLISLLLVLLRTKSTNKSLQKPPKRFREVVLDHLKTGRKLQFGWKTGSVRRELILNSRIPSNFSNTTTELKVTNPADKEILLKNLTVEGTSKRNSRIFGFFHPYCNAGGGGEKVLWKAVETTLKHDPNNIVVIYTGDKDVTVQAILDNVTKRFDYKLDTDRIVFIFLDNRKYVDSKTWPHFTLIGQAIGSIILSIEAGLKCPPDVWCDTMGYPFGYPWIYHMFRIPIVTYTHFPVISADMLTKLSQNMTLKNRFKYVYWKLFMAYYRHVGTYVSIGTTNSTWTNNHIKSIWNTTKTNIIFPPCSTEKLVDELSNTKSRRNEALCLAQYRSEKRHMLILTSFANFLKGKPNEPLKLVFIGSTRSEEDKQYVTRLETYAENLGIPDSLIEFKTDCSYEDIKYHLKTSTYGINAMWNEHFGIAVVEYLAAGLIPLVHASAGPLLDIVTKETGFFFRDASDPDFKLVKGSYPTLTQLFTQVNDLTNEEKKKRSDLGPILALKKFSDAKFDHDWATVVLDPLGKKTL